jgi:hypothetical protein
MLQTWDVAALAVAAGLSVYKPGRPRRPRIRVEAT